MVGRWLAVIIVPLLIGCVIARQFSRSTSSMPSREAHATSAVTWRGKLTWTNPCDPDLLYRTFYAVQQGFRDTLKSAPFPLSGPDEEALAARTIRRAAAWIRSGPCLRDSCIFTLPRGTWEIWVTCTDTTGRNESAQSNHVVVIQP